MVSKPRAARAVLYFHAVFFTTTFSDELTELIEPPRSNGTDDFCLTQSSFRLEKALSLTEISHATHKASAAQKDPLAPGWFGDFSEGESTYTTEGVDASKDMPSWKTKYGRDPSLYTWTDEVQPPDSHEIFNPDWYHESKSGGSADAWQTFPAVAENLAGNRGASGNRWRNTPSGWRQDYNPSRLDERLGGRHQEGKVNAAWFDNSVRQIDGFGRGMLPSVHTGDRDNADLAWTWKERSVNTTITCAEPGCTGRAALNLWNSQTEEAKLCSLSVHIHPTDYDDDWSKEHVEYLKVNDYVVSRDCNPRARGCNATAELPLYACVNQYNVDKLVDSGGNLVIEAKNSLLVDECPYKDNLLSGVVAATCMVRSKPAVLINKLVEPNLTQKCEGIVKCNKPGCTGEALIPCSPALALNGGTCKISISVAQTDYDEAPPATPQHENIEFFQVEGTNVTDAAVSPGKNPCNQQYVDNPLPEDQMWFEAVTGKDITEAMKNSRPLGWVRVTGKNSYLVDECAYKNNLLYSKVTIICTPPTAGGSSNVTFAALPPGGMKELPTILKAPAPAPAAFLQESVQSRKKPLLQKSLRQKV